MKKNTWSSRANGDQHKQFTVTVGKFLAMVLVSVIVSHDMPGLKPAGAASQFSYGKVTLSAGASPSAAKIGDLDGDGRNDIAVVNLQGSLQLFFNNGAGSYERVSLNGLWPAGSNTLDLDIGDLNGDLRTDIIVATSTQTGSVSVLFNHGNRTFGAPVNYTTCNSSKGVAIGDLDQDGDNDLADISLCNQAGILLNNGQGSFSFNGTYGYGNASRSLALADFNRDGFKDIVYLNHGTGNDGNVTMLLNNGNATFAPPQLSWVWNRSDDMAVGDFEGDGKLDVATVNAYYSVVFVLIGGGDGSFISYSELPGGDTPTGIAAADFNGDSQLDYAVISWGANRLSIFLNQGYYEYADPMTFSVGQSPVDIAAGDLDGDSLPDLVVVNQGSESITIISSAGGTPLPAAPTSLSASAASASQINLSWTDNADNEDGFKLDRCQGSGCSNFTEIARVSANTTAFSNTGLAAGVSYSYRVRAFNSGGDSGHSNPAAATTQGSSGIPTAPSNLRLTAIGFSRIDLAWNDQSNDETRFELERCRGSVCSNFAKIAEPAANATSSSNSGLSRRTTYRYRIRACRESSCSAYSTIANGITK